MNLNDLKHLQSADTVQLVEHYLNCDPLEVALRTRDRILSDQVKYLARAKTKLPSWYSARCVINSQLFEQSSSEATAKAKFEGVNGRCAIDLTCGLGVDGYALSANFDRVISVEIDPVKAEVTRHNFGCLGVNNVEVIDSSAEEFCQQAVDQGVKADLIYVDPSRVDADGKKVYSLEQSSPNVLTLMPLLRRISDRIMIKLSPLFDVDECFRLFDCVQSVEVVSVNGECKEVIVLINTLDDSKQKTINHTIIRADLISRYPISLDDFVQPRHDKSITKLYLYEPDVAFYKSRCVERYMIQAFDNVDFVFDNYIFTSQPIVGFTGAGYIVEDAIPYNARKIKQLLDSRGITKATIHLRDFQISQQQLYKTLKINEGMAAHLVFTTTDGVPTCYIVNSLNDR